MEVMQLTRQGQAEETPLCLVDIPTPQPGPGQVLVRVHACGVCHTDLHLVEGDIHPPALPLTPGHQVVGTIEALGPPEDKQYPSRPQLSVGDRVGIPWLHFACGECSFCRRGQENLCPQALFTGFHVNGGFGRFMLAQASHVLLLPDQIPDQDAAPLLCAGIVGYRSLRFSDLNPGERLGLAGFGASAHLVIQVARYWGCPVSVFTRSPEHQKHARELGADWAGGVDQTLPELMDRAILFAPAGELVPLMLSKIRPGGTLAINAIHMSPIPEMPYSLIYGERTLRTVTNATYQDGLEFLHLAAAIPIVPTVASYSLQDANRALVDLKHSRLNGEAVLQIGD
jgi:propanol-preferring alcohol dehydrogenase